LVRLVRHQVEIRVVMAELLFLMPYLLTRPQDVSWLLVAAVGVLA
jgi:hypothetical protein